MNLKKIYQTFHGCFCQMLIFCINMSSTKFEFWFSFNTQSTMDLGTNKCLLEPHVCSSLSSLGKLALPLLHILGWIDRRQKPFFSFSQSPQSLLLLEKSYKIVKPLIKCPFPNAMQNIFLHPPTQNVFCVFIRDARGSVFLLRGGAGQGKRIFLGGGAGQGRDKILGAGQSWKLSGPGWSGAAIFPGAGAGRASLVFMIYEHASQVVWKPLHQTWLFFYVEPSCVFLCHSTFDTPSPLPSTLNCK